MPDKRPSVKNERQYRNHRAEEGGPDERAARPRRGRVEVKASPSLGLFLLGMQRQKPSLDPFEAGRAFALVLAVDGLFLGLLRFLRRYGFRLLRLLRLGRLQRVPSFRARWP